jgi:hypothetical protein
MNIDLAFSGTTNTFTISPGRYQFLVKNYAPAGNYDAISIIIENVKIPVLPNAGSIVLNNKIIKTNETFSGDAQCELDTLIDDLSRIDSEKKVLQFWNTIDFSSYNCSQEDKERFKLKFNAMTSWFSHELTVEKDQKIVVTIKKLVGDEPVTRTWTYETPQRGAWITSYGFNFVSRIISEEQHYFVSRIPGDTSYIISEERDPEKVSIAASIMFSWVPNKKQKIPFSFSGGLGADTENLSVFAGGAFVINYNIFLNLGMAGHYKWDLLGKYDIDETVLDELEFSQLHEKVFAFNPYVGIAFRFADNPFEKAEGAE